MQYVSTVERYNIEREIERSMNEGFERGIGQGIISSLTMLLTSRFGPLSDAVTARLSVAPLEQLQAWFGRAVGAVTMEDVFRDAQS